MSTLDTRDSSETLHTSKYVCIDVDIDMDVDVNVRIHIDMDMKSITIQTYLNISIYIYIYTYVYHLCLLLKHGLFFPAQLQTSRAHASLLFSPSRPRSPIYKNPTPRVSERSHNRFISSLVQSVKSLVPQLFFRRNDREKIVLKLKQPKT